MVSDLRKVSMLHLWIAMNRVLVFAKVCQNNFGVAF